MDTLVRVPEAAKTLAMSPRKLWDLLKSGEVPYYRFGRQVRIAADDLRAYADRHRVGR